MADFTLSRTEQQKLTPKQWRLVQISMSGELSPLMEEQAKMHEVATRFANMAKGSLEPDYHLGMAAHYAQISGILRRVIDARLEGKKVRVQ